MPLPKTKKTLLKFRQPSVEDLVVSDDDGIQEDTQVIPADDSQKPVNKKDDENEDGGTLGLHSDELTQVSVTEHKMSREPLGDQKKCLKRKLFGKLKTNPSVKREKKTKTVEEILDEQDPGAGNNFTVLGLLMIVWFGTTLSGTATSEYVPIGLICQGMNKQFYGRNKEYSVHATDPMKPVGVKNISAKEMAYKWYKHIPSNALCVPQPIEQYYVHEWNRSENPDINKLPQYMVHNYGVARMDEKVHQFLINQAIGQSVAHYTYKPKNGLIRASKDHFVPWNRNGDAVETSCTRPRSMLLQFFQDKNRKPVIGDVGLGADKDVTTLINTVEENYYRMVDNYGAFHPAHGVTSFEAQPQLHVGLVATPQLNPATASISYLNSACYWKVETTCTITFNLNSAFSFNNAISWPLEVTFIRNAIPKYTDGQCLFGNTDTKSGNVNAVTTENTTTDNEMSDNEENDFEILRTQTKKIKL